MSEFNDDIEISLRMRIARQDTEIARLKESQAELQTLVGAMHEALAEAQGHSSLNLTERQSQLAVAAFAERQRSVNEIARLTARLDEALKIAQRAGCEEWCGGRQKCVACEIADALATDTEQSKGEPITSVGDYHARMAGRPTLKESITTDREEG